MILKVDRFRLFVDQRLLNAVSKHNKWPAVGPAKWFWFEPEILRRLSLAFGIRQNELERRLLAALERGRQVRAIQGRDFIAVHPRALGLILSGWVKRME